MLVNNRVILEIKRLISHSSMSIKEISYITGFDEPANMTKYFKLHTNKTPTEFKNETAYLLE